MHCDVPVAHEVVPTRQADGSQGMLFSQATQAPLLHTRPLPQFLPFGAFPDSWHCEVPVEHEVVPVLHGLPVLHDTSGVQGLQVPLLQ